MKTIRETLTASDYKINKKVRSQIDPTKLLDKYPNKYSCPKCKKELTLLHGEGSTICECKLGIRLSGNALYCYFEKE